MGLIGGQTFLCLFAFGLAFLYLYYIKGIEFKVMQWNQAKNYQEKVLQSIVAGVHANRIRDTVKRCPKEQNF